MGVLKFAENYENHIAFYNAVCERMKRKYSVEKDLKKDLEDAEYLTEFFYNLKNLKKSTYEFSQNKVNIPNIAYAQIHSVALKELGRRGNTLFRQVDDSVNRGKALQNDADSILEFELDKVLKIVEKVALKNTTLKTNFKSSTHLSGRSSVNIDDEILKTIEDYKKMYQEEVSEKVINEFKAATKIDKDILTSTSASGKTDIEGGFTNINIETEVRADFQRLAYILKNSTFTAKNYTSDLFGGTETLEDGKTKTVKKIVSTRDLHLGNTNPTKAILAVLSSLNFSPKDSVAGYFAMIKNMEYLEDKINDGLTIKTHLYQLRFAYELSGAGLFANGVSLNDTRFLIYNDPKGDEIKVYSTRNIINNLLDKSEINGAWKEISYKVSTNRENKKYKF